MSFFLRHALAAVVVAGSFCGSFAAQAAEPTLKERLDGSKRLLFLGDSITAGGTYVAQFDAWLTATRRDKKPLVLNAGLASETISGLSEDGHAGGKFPRPDLFERLDRVLAETKPDLVVACYGMNCGIYLPLDEARFAKYQAGARRLKAAVEKSGAQLIFATPPYHDVSRNKLPFVYNDVLGRYGAWLLAQREHGWQVVDVHEPMTAHIEKARAANPEFTVQRDGVHPNAEGHWLMARELIRSFGDPKSADCATTEEMLTLNHISPECFKLIVQRMSVLRDAYVSAAGHLRPGVAKGLPVAEAEQKAAALTQQINALLTPKP